MLKKSLAVLLMIFFCQQVFSESAMQASLAQINDAMKTTEKMNTMTFSSNEESECFVDSMHYYIGAGDVFLISPLNSTNFKIKAVVDENSNLLLADFGVVKLGKVSLVAAKAEIRNFLAQKIKEKSDIYVSFIRAKAVSVTILGVVANPGTIQVSGKARLFDALKLVNNGSVSLNDWNVRNIEIDNGDSVKYIDLFPYALKGSLEENPYVYPGDIIRVAPATERAYVGGAIRNTAPGSFPIKKDETIKDFLSFFLFDATADSSKIIIRHGTDIASQTIVLAGRENILNEKIQHQDILLIPVKENYPAAWMVSVEGEVLSPGAVPILKNRTTLEDVFRFTGGLTSEGDETRTVIIRRSKVVESLKQTDASLKESQNLSMRPEINTSIIRAYSSLDYTIIPVTSLREKIVLENQDLVFVPKKDPFIYLSGNVAHPGAYEYVSGAKLGHYIDQAGGFSTRADKGNTFVISAYGRYYQIKDFKNLHSGDMIVVPDGMEHKTFLTMFLPVFNIVMTTISLIAAIYISSKK